jgi:DNA-binding response OmpR family regulator
LKIGILDDNPDDRDWVCQILRSADHDVTEFENGKSLLRALRLESFDALIVDWNLPDLAGTEVISKVRNELLLDIPVILVTARDTDMETVEGLKAGADDYITKPAQKLVLLARLEAITRRRIPNAAFGAAQQFGSFSFDIARRTVQRDGETIVVTDREFRVALVLFQHLGRAVSRDYLLSAVWGHTTHLESRTLDVHISRVRSKLQLVPEFGWRLATVYGFGYRLETAAE